MIIRKALASPALWSPNVSQGSVVAVAGSLAVFPWSESEGRRMSTHTLFSASKTIGPHKVGFELWNLDIHGPLGFRIAAPSSSQALNDLIYRSHNQNVGSQEKP